MISLVLVISFLFSCSICVKSLFQHSNSCDTKIIFPQNNSIVNLLVSLPLIRHLEEPKTEVSLEINTTCRDPISINLSCISEMCGDVLLGFQYNEVEPTDDLKAFGFRIINLLFNITYGNYLLEAGNESSYFSVKKKFKFRQINEQHRYLEEPGFKSLAYILTFGKGTVWNDWNRGIIILDYMPWTIQIGSFVSIARNVEFLLSLKGGLHRYDFISQYAFDHALAYAARESYRLDITKDFAGRREIIIGHDVWIGYNAKIINSITIGTGAVIGAYAVVREDIPPYAIVIGDPARIVKYRFNETQIAWLLEIAWWNWEDDEEILLRMPRRDDFDALVEYYHARKDKKHNDIIEDSTQQQLLFVEEQTKVESMHYNQ